MIELIKKLICIDYEGIIPADLMLQTIIHYLIHF